MVVLYIELLSHWSRHVIPLPCDVLTVRTGWLRKEAPQGSCCQFLGHLPDPALRVVREEEELLLRVPVEGSQEPVAVVFVPLSDEGPGEVTHGLRHRPVLVNCVIHLIFGARALLDLGHPGLVALELYRGVVLPDASAARDRFARINVQLRVVSAAVPLRTRLVLVLEHLDSCMRLPEVRSDEPLRSSEGVIEVLFGCIVLVNRPSVVLSQEFEETSSLVLPDSSQTTGGDHDAVTVWVAGEGLEQV